MELNASVSAVVTGVIIPFILPLIMQSKWSSKTKSLVTLGIALVAGVINTILTGQGADIATVLTGTVVVYQSLNKTGIFDTISEATDFNKDKDSVPTPPEGYKAGAEE